MRLILVFASSFQEGDLTTAGRISGSPDLDDAVIQVHRRRVVMVEDFDVVHNVLYYMYTNSITFSTTSSQDSDKNENGEPSVGDTEAIYALAHRLDLESLQSKALRFLEMTCTVRNITDRVFGEFASLYEEVGEIYEKYFKKHWVEVRETQEFGEYFSMMEEKEDFAELRRVFRKFRELM